MRKKFIEYIAKIDGREVSEVERIFSKFDDERVEKMVIKLMGGTQ